jgi:hypothetical protein
MGDDGGDDEENDRWEEAERGDNGQRRSNEKCALTLSPGHARNPE